VIFIKRFVFLVLIFLLTFFFNLLNYRINRIFLYIDISFIVCFLLLINNNKISAYLFCFFIYFLNEIFLMPIFGMTLFTSITALFFAEWLSHNLYIKSFITKMVVFLASYIVKVLLYFILITIFYRGGKIYFWGFEFVILKILITSVLFLILIKIMDIKKVFIR